MKICLLNGNPDGVNAGFDERLAALVDGWSSQSHRVTRFDLRSQNIVSCTGCWSCWLKTPGLCAVKDDTHAVRDAFINADLAVFASPLVYGFPSAVLKDSIDKLIPLVLPYIRLTNGECMHAKRYEKMPSLACLLGKETDSAQEDLDLVSSYFRRVAEQFHSTLLFSRLVSDPVEEVLDEINRL